MTLPIKAREIKKPFKKSEVANENCDSEAPAANNSNRQPAADITAAAARRRAAQLPEGPPRRGWGGQQVTGKRSQPR